MKTCTKCDKEYPTTAEFFPPNKRVKGNLGSWCRKCIRTAIKIWREKNPKKCREYDKKHRQENKEKRREYARYYNKTLRGYVTHLVSSIRDRCNNPNCKAYKYYGARGVKCLFTTAELYSWVITNSIDPRGLCIHRIDNGNYMLSNIVFLSKSEHLKLHHEGLTAHQDNNQTPNETE